MVSLHQSRLISLSIYCTAILLHNLSPVDAFSLVQNAAADGSTAAGGGDGARRSSASASAADVGGGRSSASPSAASASAAAAANPFRGSLNSRQPRRRRRVMNSREEASAPSSNNDFALRMGVQSDLEQEQMDDCHHLQSHQCDDDSHQDGNKMPAAASSSSCSSSNCQSENDNNSNHLPSSIDDEKQVYERRKFLHGMLATTAAATAGFTAISSTANPIVEPANAYEQSYPLELQSTPINEVETSSNSLTKLQEERLTQKKAKVAATALELRNDPLGLSSLNNNNNNQKNNPLSDINNNFGLTIAGASTWALALWFATGSRSNPIVTPLANVLYDDTNEEWLADRNDGYFGDLPLSFTAILSAVFVFLGVVLDRTVYFLADGDAAVSLQLAGVSVIGGAVWEVGRLAAKEKAPTREEYERDVLLYQEFEEFANKRLVVGRGSCHRSDVVSAFRRYNPKYRVADNEQYALADIEIERILRAWNREFGSGSEMSSAGFFSGISVDGGADAFAPR
ncbi:hypothetical protein ACHAXR_008726 [Thalassiosira sp. AJA248-18]